MDISLCQDKRKRANRQKSQKTSTNPVFQYRLKLMIKIPVLTLIAVLSWGEGYKRFISRKQLKPSRIPTMAELFPPPAQCTMDVPLLRTAIVSALIDLPW